ncbi:MAG: ATP-dependent RecD-like DNA helicase [Melioribacteraceae bacterium]|nr:ATP-dependent RecD-like DNA helicase [Melioribacteraceae bacterium]
METIQSIIDIYLFHNDENGYSVLKLEDGTIAVGALPFLNEGEAIELTGEWGTHPKYGEQFKFNAFKILQPTTSKGIISYLSSGLIKGIGPTYAAKIVRKFGNRTFDIFDTEIDRLLEIEGIGNKKLELIKESWKSQKGVKDVMVFLQEHGITTALAIKIYKTYGNKTIDIINENPYRLTFDIWGVGFKSADKIGKSFGITDHDPIRIKAGIIYILNEATSNGHTYLPSSDLIQKCLDILDFDLAHNDPILEELESENQIIVDKDNLYIPNLYFAERYIEKKLNSLLESPQNFTKEKLSKIRIEQTKFSEEQVNAIKNSVEEKLLVLTGGPGTGKTTTLKGIIDIYTSLGKKIMLAAPTGRAAKRMSELCGLESKTIHRLLEYNPMTQEFNHGEDDPLETDLLIIDETSMIDTVLMYYLLKAVCLKTTLVLVGDSDQLPSVGAGNVLIDILQSGKIPVVKLTKIFRQAEESQIIVAAHEINKGKIPTIINSKSSDLFFIEEENHLNIPQKIYDLCSERLPKAYDIDPFTDLQILAPMYKGECGVDNLNSLFQNNLNNNPVLLSRGNRTFKFNDKVMQLTNNYDKEVFNGDQGFVRSVNNEAQTMIIEFNERPVKYDFSDLDEITLAYAITVHKSQGSEYPFVIMPITTAHFIMLQRNLLYTGITRASEMLILIGSRRALALAVQNDRVKMRYTSLFKG